MTANKQQQQLILAMQSMALYNSIKNHENFGGHMPTAQISHVFRHQNKFFQYSMT